MKGNCTPIYLDIDGKPSADYYGVVDQLGEEAALKNYIQRTLPAATAKFSKEVETPMDKLNSRSMGRSEAGYIGITTALDAYGTEIPPKVVNYLALRMRAYDEFKKVVKTEPKEADLRKNIEDAKAFFDVDEETYEPRDETTKGTFEKYKADVRALWDYQQKMGTAEHEFLEYVAKEWNETDPDDRHLFKFDEIIAEATEKFKATSNAYNDEVITDPMIPNLKLVGRTLLSFIQEQEDKYGDLEVMTEQSIIGESVVLGGKKVHGRADLLLYSKEKNKAIIVDFKTKSKKSFQNFDSTNVDRMAEPFDSLYSNAESHLKLQLGFYSKILKEDYGVDSVDTKVMFIVGDYAKSPDAEPGNADWTLNYIDGTQQEIRNVSPPEGLIQKVIEPEKTKVEPSKIDTDLDTYFDGKMEELASNFEKYKSKALNSVTKDESGKFVWTNMTTHKKTQTLTIKEMEEEMKKAYKELNDMRKNAAVTLKEMFMSPTLEAPKNSIWANPKNRKRAFVLLDKYDPKTHTFYTADDLPELATLSRDFLIVKDNTTGDLDFIAISGGFNSNRYFNEDGEEMRSTIYGPLITDATANTRWPKDMVPKANVHNMQLLRLGLIAAEVKKKLPDLGHLNNLLSVTLLDNANSAYQSESHVETQFAHISNIATLLEETGKDVPELFSYVKNTPSLTSEAAVKTNYLTKFLDMIRAHKDPLAQIDTKTVSRGAKKIAEDIRKRIEYLEDQQLSFESDYELRELLMEYQKKLYFALERTGKKKDSIYADPFYNSVNLAYLTLRGLYIPDRPTFKKSFLHEINSAMTSDDKNAAMLHKAIVLSEQEARDDIVDDIAEHQVLLKAVMDEAGVSFGSRVVSTDVFKKVFEPMLEDKYSFDSTNVENWMKFKDPDDPHSKLTDAQKAYIRFFNEKIKKAAKELYSGKTYSLMFGGSEEDGFEKIDTGDMPKWQKGYIPIIPKGASAKLTDTMLMRRGVESGITDIFRSVKQAFGSLARPVDNGKEKDMEPWSFTEIFTSQVDMSPGRGSNDTRRLLGIDDKNTVIGKRKDIELNPAAVLNLMIVEGARKKFMGEAAFAAAALDAKIVNDELHPGVEGAEARKLMNNIAQLRIYQTVDNEGRAAKVIDSLGKTSSFLIFGASIRQFFADSIMTGLYSNTSMLGNVFSYYIFKGDVKYLPADKAWAKKHMFSTFGHQLMVDFGMFNSSLGEFTEDDYVGTRSASMWQTKWATAHFHSVLRHATQDIIMAQMHHQGITEKAYIRNEKTGRYEYREELDPRFYVYDPDNKEDWHEEKPPQTDDEKRRWVFWKAVKRDLDIEHGVDQKTGRMRRPFTAAQLDTMKQYAIKQFGSLDNSEAMSAEKVSAWRALLKFKKWVKHRWYFFNVKTQTHARESKYTEVRDAEGNVVDFKFAEQEFEGLVQSIYGMGRAILNNGISRAIHEASDIRKENLGKLMADLLLVLALYSFYLFMEAQDMFDSDIGKELRKGMTNAFGDAIPVYSLYYALNGNSMASVSVLSNTIGQGMQAMTYAVTGDIDKAKQAADQSASILGGYRTTKAIMNIITGE